MPLQPDKDLKLYYSINEVAQQFDVAESCLRFWEQEFPQLKPHKAGRNIRQYTKEDVETVRVIHNLVKVRGLKISAARALLNKNKVGAQNTAEVIERLNSVRERLVAMRSALSSGVDE